MTFWKWSQTAANNATADTTCPFPEQMAASALNDSSRGLMAAAAKYRDDTSGLITTAGTLTAYTVSTFEVYDSLAHLHENVVWFTPHTTNGDTVTLNADSLGAKPLRSAPGVELVAGTLIQGTPYGALYNNTDGAWYLQGFYSSPLNVPLLGGMDYWDTTAPNSRFIFPAGQALSRTVYAYAFSKWGTTYGSGDGSTTFNVPDKTGRVSAMKESVGTRLTTAGGGVDGGTMGSSGGAQTETLATTNLPPYTPTGTITNGAISIINLLNIIAGGGPDCPGGGSVGNATSPSSAFALSQAASTFAGAAQGGASTPFSRLPPLIVCNYIIRVL